MIYEPFKIVVVSFPFSDIEAKKRRPALVLSSMQHQAHCGHITLCMITSAKHSHWPDDHKIIDLKSAGLTMACVVRQKIFSLDNRLIIESIGQLAQADQKQVLFQLGEHISR